VRLSFARPQALELLSTCARDGRLDVQVGVAFTRFQTRYFKGRYLVKQLP
jgi:hypothetical protein